MNNNPLDSLVFLIVSEKQVNRLMKQLSREGFHFTVINSTGGIGQIAEICLLIGFSHEQKPALMAAVHKSCKPYKEYIPTQGLLPSEAGSLPLLEVQVGGALVYSLEVERFEQF